MIAQTTTQFAGYACLQLENEALALWLTRAVGPRLIGLALAGGDNLLAVVPDAAVKTPSGKVFRFRGGHRLWHAPEDPERTYVPDDDPVTITAVARGVRAVQPVEPLTGIEKSITVTLPDDTARVVVDHQLANRHVRPVTLAPWAITQFRPGGFGILPQPAAGSGLLPNRRLALWPYTPINSPYVQWGDRFIFVQAAMREGMLKLGWANAAGWLAYWREGILFVKQAPYYAAADYYDFGSSSECYCDPRFLELETMGPRVTLVPGETAVHREIWQVYPNVSLAPEETAVADIISRLGIGKEMR